MTESQIPIHPLSGNPSAAWDQLRHEQKVLRLNVKPPTSPPSDNMVNVYTVRYCYFFIKNYNVIR